MEGEQTKTRYQQIRDGDVEPVGIEKGWLNMRPITDRPKEEELAIRRKAQLRQAEKKKELRTMKETLVNILNDKDMAIALAKANGNELLIRATENGATVNDLLMLSATIQGLEGNVKALDFVRDTSGQRPKDDIQINADIVTSADRKLIENLRNRLGVVQYDEESEEQ